MPNTLILVPTEQERRHVPPACAGGLRAAGRVELCGFGPVAAAARTATLVAAHAPDRVLLLGSAGRLADGLRIGAAYRFDRVACHGIGAGVGAEFVPAGALGWIQWPGEPPDPATAVGDVIDLPMPPGAVVSGSGLLLTACAASATASDVAVRRSLFPAAVAEDMEGFAVALACRLHAVPLAIVRGISNVAGDRDHAGWQMAPAVAAAAELAFEILKEPW